MDKPLPTKEKGQLADEREPPSAAAKKSALPEADFGNTTLGDHPRVRSTYHGWETLRTIVFRRDAEIGTFGRRSHSGIDGRPFKR